MFGASSELASVMEFGFNYVEAVAKVFRLFHLLPQERTILVHRANRQFMQMVQCTVECAVRSHFNIFDLHSNLLRYPLRCYGSTTQCYRALHAYTFLQRAALQALY